MTLSHVSASKESFKSLFALNESLADIKTQNGLRDFMVNVSKQSQLLMPLSNEYFSTKEGQVLIFEGIREFEDFHTMNVRDLNVNVDIREFTITAWVQYETEGGGNIVRKPRAWGQRNMTQVVGVGMPVGPVTDSFSAHTTSPVAQTSRRWRRPST